MYIVGQDIGNGYIKTVAPGRRPVVFPSVVGSAEEIRFRNPLASGGGLEVSLNGDRFFVGEHALLQSRRLITERGRRRDPTVLKVLSLTGLWRLFPGGCEVYLVTGLPVIWFQEKDRREFQGLFLGEHEAVINGRKASFNVKDVVVMPQPFGSLFHLLLSDDGKVMDEGLARRRVGVIDIGMHTVDLILVDGLHYVEKGSGSLPYGVDRVLGDVRKDLQDQYDVDLPIPGVDEVVRRGRLSIYGREENVGHIIEPHLLGRVCPKFVGMW